MLWYKSWLETRWRFLIGLALLSLMACGTVLDYRAVVALMPAVSSSSLDTSGPLGRLLGYALEFQRTYRGYIWWQWFRQNLPQTWTLLAVILGSGGLVAQGARGGALFSLSMPVSRARLLGVRVATGFAELFALAIGPSLVVPLLSPSIGQHYAVSDALVHALCLFTAGAVFFCLAELFSTVFADVWRPALFTCLVAVPIWFLEITVPGLIRYGPFSAMGAETYLLNGTLPWAGLFISLAASALLISAAVVNITRHEF
jgi:hypothetical protein